MEFLAGLHPKVVHFAIGLLLTYSFLEILSAFIKKDFLSKAAYIILFLGVLAALAAVLSGNQAEEVAERWEDSGAIIPFGLISEHEEFATITVWFYAALLVIRTVFILKKKFTSFIHYIFVLLVLIGSYFIYQTGEYGGNLVYKHGIGTDLINPDIKK